MDDPRERAGGPTHTRNGESAHTRSGAAPAHRRRRKSGSSAAVSAAVYVVAVIGVSVLLALLGWNWAKDVLALDKEPHTAVIQLSSDLFTPEEITVKTKGADGETVKTQKSVQRVNVGKLANILKENGIIEHKGIFKLFVAVTGANVKMTPGSYQLNTDMDYRALIANMSPGSASRTEVTVTIPEGYTSEQIFALLEEKGVASAESLRKAAAEHDYNFSFLKDIPLGSANRLEGYLFPDTYQFYVGHDPVYVLNKMLVNFSQMVSEETRKELEADGRSLHELIIIASMIEKETDGTDQANISSVIQNRLKNTGATGGLLQIDATLVYINGGEIPTEADKSIDSPYNTYLYPGLPAGPISNPGTEAIWAAMNPNSTGSYYYALDPATGRHTYSKTLQEHQAVLASLPQT